MTESQRHSAYELFWTVKGHLKPFTDHELELIREEYTGRLWYNEEAHLYSEGFDSAYSQLKSAIKKGL